MDNPIINVSVLLFFTLKILSTRFDKKKKEKKKKEVKDIFHLKSVQQRFFKIRCCKMSLYTIEI